MIKDGLYHKDIYLPKIKLSDKPIKVNYTLHAIEAAYTDPRGDIELNEYITPSEFDLIEAEIKDSKLYKVVIRKSYNEYYDIIMVIQTDSNNVKTVWLNDKGDCHKTLNVKKYMPDPRVQV